MSFEPQDALRTAESCTGTNSEGLTFQQWCDGIGVEQLHGLTDEERRGLDYFWFSCSGRATVRIALPAVPLRRVDGETLEEAEKERADHQYSIREAYSYIGQLRAELATANDLLRWRSMTELPDTRNPVIIKHIFLEGCQRTMLLGFYLDGAWVDDEGTAIESLDSYEWAYGPSQGPRGQSNG
jgi:hypothetical protein